MCPNPAILNTHPNLKELKVKNHLTLNCPFQTGLKMGIEYKKPTYEMVFIGEE
jgi:hypothetical protein